MEEENIVESGTFELILPLFKRGLVVMGGD